MIDAEKMKASWLEAVANGEAEGFSRHFMPDILDALAASQERVRVLEGALAVAVMELKNICMNPSNAVALGRSALKRIAALKGESR